MMADGVGNSSYGVTDTPLQVLARVRDSGRIAEMNGGERGVFLVILSRADNLTGECYPGLASIAADAGMSERNARRAVKSLTEKGLLENVTASRGRTASFRRVSCPPTMAQDVTVEDANHGAACHGSERSTMAQRVTVRPLNHGAGRHSTLTNPASPSLSMELTQELPRGGKRKSEPKKIEEVAIPTALDTQDFRRVWAEWKQDRRDRKNPVTALGAMKQLRDLERMGVGSAIDTINRSISNGWTGLVFPDRRQPVRAINGSSRSISQSAVLSTEDQ